MRVAARDVEALAPCLKRRLSGVTATAFRVVPAQARTMGVALVGPGIPEGLPEVGWRDVLALGRDRPRVWHARRNVEMLAGLALRAIGKDLRLVFTSASQRRHTAWTRWLIRRMDAVVATSARSASYLEREAVVVHHGIDAAAFRPAADRAALRRSLGLPAEGPIVGCFGRIRAQKGTGDFVEAMARVLPGRAGTAVVLGRATAEHRAYLDGLRARVDGAGLAGRVIFADEVPVDRVASWHAALDLFVAPQRWEGFGVTPLEAMASGVPVVATRVGAFEEIVAPDTGRLVDPGDVAALAAAVGAMLDDPAAMVRLGAAGRERVVARFRLEDEAEALNAVYRRVLARP